MATIFSKANPTGSANCAVLASLENYYAPFYSNIGTWTQLRVSAYLSYCGASGFNSSPVPETINTTAPNLAWWWGIGSFVSSLGLSVPISIGSNFIGISSYGQSSTIFQYYATSAVSSVTTISTQTKMAVVSSNGSTYSSTVSAAADYLFFQPYLNTGTVNYCVPTTMVFTIFNKGQTGQQIGFISSFDGTGGNVNVASFTDIPLLRIASQNLLGSGIESNTSFTVYYTTGLVATGGPLPVPDTVYFHSPFNNNLLRIHNLLVEKFY